jgi:hypothetical protein
MAGITEALSEGHSRDEILALSIGTATVQKIPAALAAGLPDEFVEKPQPRRWYSAIRDAATCILDDPPDAASFTAHVVLGGTVGTRVPGDRVIRMNPVVRPVRANAVSGDAIRGDASGSNRWAVPRGFSWKTLAQLQELQMDAVAQDEVLLIKQLADTWISGDFANQPIRENDRLECQIGSATFPEALNHLRGWLPQ